MKPKASALMPFGRYLQVRLIELFEEEGILAKDVRTTLAVDAAYEGSVAYASAVLFDVRKKVPLRSWNVKTDVFFPYIPGYLYLREAPPLVKLLSRVDQEYDLLLVDAHGRLHPRRAGLATMLGIILRKPTIGIAKSLLVGSIVDVGDVSPVSLKGEILGYRVQTDGSTFYVSQGNLISLDEAMEFLRVRGNGYPEELRIVDQQTKQFKRNA